MAKRKKRAGKRTTKRRKAAKPRKTRKKTTRTRGEPDVARPPH